MLPRPPRLPAVHRARPGNRRAQRGAIGLIGIITLLLALMFAALSIDSGRLWLERRSLQRTADMAAIEAARYTGCGSTPADALAAASASATRNGLKAVSGGPAVLANRGRISTDASGQRQFTESAFNDDQSDSVKVQVFKQVPSSLVLGGLFGEQLLLSAEATAQGTPPITAFTLGSAMVAINPDSKTMINGILGGVLGTNLDISLLSYQGLADVKVDLASLVKLQGSVGTVDELLGLNMGLGDALALFGQASGNQSPEASLGLSQLIRAANLAGKTIKLGDVLSVGTPSEPALAGININLLNLIVVAVQVSNDQSGYFNLPINIKGITQVQLQMGAKPSIAIGSAGRSSTTGGWCTIAKTASMNLSLQVDALDSISKLLGGLIEFDFKLQILGAPATAHVNRIQLAPGTSHVEMGVTTGMIGIKIGNRAGTGPATMNVNIFGLRFGVDIWLDPTDQTGFALLDVPIDTPVEEHLPVSAQGSSNASGVVASILGDNMRMRVNVGVISIPIDALLNAVIKAVSSLLESLVDPLIQITGVQPGAAMVQVFYLGGAQPQLVR